MELLDRYEGRPQLAIIESYALDVIGELSDDEMQEAAQAVSGFFGEAPGDWRSRVRQQMGWSLLKDAVIADEWCRFRKAVRAAGGEPVPADFARRFADEVIRLSRS